MFAPRRVPPLLHDFRAGIVQRHEGDRSGGDTQRRFDLCAGRPKSREGETRPTARLVNERHRFERIVNAALSVGESVIDRQDEAG